MKETTLNKYFGICPDCEDNNVFVYKREIVINVKGEEVVAEEEFCRCEKCGEEFQTAEQMNQNNIRALDAYRKAHNLLTSEEIKNIRNKYKISQVEFAWFIGVGEKTITRYETKQIQEESNDRLMRLVDTDYNYAMQSLKQAKEKFDEERYNYLLNSLKCFILLNNHHLTELALENDYVEFDQCSEYNGYKLLDIPKIKSMIAYFVRHTKNVFKVKLMKLLWYCDAKSYIDLGQSMSGLVYKHLSFGALPIGYQRLMELDSVNVDESFIVDGNVVTRLVPKEYDTFDLNLFSNDEIGILQKVCKKFENAKGSTISDIMHREDAYINTDMGEFIPFSIIKSIKAL